MPVGFSGGAAMERKLRELAEKLGDPETLRVGFLEGKNYPDGGPPVAMVAAVQNFGAPAVGVPARPFFSNMVREKSPEWPDNLAAIAKHTGFDMHGSLGQMGELIIGQLQDAIVATDAPALSEVTLMLRKMRADDQSLVVTGSTVVEARRRVEEGERATGVNTAVLIDTSLMLHSVSSELQDGLGE